MSKIVKILKRRRIMKERQKILLPEVNIGLVGHVDHGKTTLTKSLTGRWTDTHSEELKRGISIRLGYADATFYKCDKCGYCTAETCPECGKKTKPIRTVSFVDAPGHETLMTTVLSGSALMDGALLIISAHEKCPQPQTREHLTALDIVGIKNIIIVQNKIDLVSEKEAKENYKQIKNFVKGTVAEKAPIIPISAQHKINMDVLIEAIEKNIPTPKRDPKKPPLFFVARSFDVNKPGTSIKKLGGGIIGGSLVQGKLKVGDDVEIKPGVSKDGEFMELTSKITGLQQTGQDLEFTEPGGLLGVMTELDPYLTKGDSLSGNVIGLKGKLPETIKELEMETNLLKRVVGTKEELKVDPIKINDMLMLTVGVARTIGPVTSTGKKVKVKLKIPVCAERGQRVAISRQIQNRWRLIGHGIII